MSSRTSETSAGKGREKCHIWGVERETNQCEANKSRLSIPTDYNQLTIDDGVIGLADAHSHIVLSIEARNRSDEEQQGDRVPSHDDSYGIEFKLQEKENELALGKKL